MSSSNINSIAPFLKGRLEDAFEAIGITQFPSETSWYQVIGGLVVQGGKIDVAGGATVTVNLNAPYETQVLGIWLQVSAGAGNNGSVGAVTLADFQIINGVGARTYYWLSLGV